MKYVLENKSENYELMGGKAVALSKIGMLIDNVPEWFCVSFEGFDVNTKEILQEAKNEIEEKLKKFPDNCYFAVRSSAGNEDSSENSFAGQFETFLYVKKEEVVRKSIRSVYVSIFK